MPTKKWFAALITGVLTILTNWIVSGQFDGTERGQLVALAIALTGAYFKTNDNTYAGIPARRRKP